ncbi:hypothetical protein CQW23_07925 [Capsicum baccatum]|uniref:Uncharacterized protein n=1 Tax=Capsicum baccatum TaxID=33114 RepID=A0A2G2X7K1_CAPBA|nr:hypothetical protein CQW23_07925 [Capsicum baccatum]
MIVDSRHGKRRAIKEGAVNHPTTNHPTAEDANELILNNVSIKNKISCERNLGTTQDESEEANTMNARIDEQERKISADTFV